MSFPASMTSALIEGHDATSRNAAKNPYEGLISFTYGFLRFPPLAGAITDMHFVTRNRFGRTAVFMARQIADGKAPGTVRPCSESASTRRAAS